MRLLWLKSLPLSSLFVVGLSQCVSEDYCVSTYSYWWYWHRRVERCVARARTGALILNAAEVAVQLWMALCSLVNTSSHIY